VHDPDFIEKFGLLFEQEGLPRIAGRIIGFLMLEGGPCALDDLSERLQISKTSASTNTRLLEQLGILDHISKAGDRRDYYQLAGDYGERMFAMAKQRLERFRKLLTETSASLPASEEGSRTRLESMLRFYEFLLADMDGVVARWRAFQGAGIAGGSNTGTE
jgi:DNA-binding transcriptional regulator GbsR (MarR family)